MDEDLLESSRVSDKEQHPIPAGEGGRVTEAPVHQDRDSHRSEQAGPDVDVACGGDQLCRGDGGAIEAPPPPRLVTRDAPSRAHGATPREPAPGGGAMAAAPRRSRARVLRGLIAAALA